MTVWRNALRITLLLVVAQGAVLSGLLYPAGSAIGATPEAWAAHEKEVVTACVLASKLVNAKPGGKIIDFADGVGFSALVIDGRYPQPHMKNKHGRALCLFDKRARTPYVSGADAIVGKSRR